MTSRSTTTSIACLNFLSSSGMPSSSTTSWPSTFARVKPSRISSSKTSLCSPLRSRTSGALTVNRVPSSSRSTWSTIASIDWPAIGLPQIGQCGRPDPRVEQPEVVVDLGDRADRRARVARRRLLVDRDRRAEAVDVVDVRLLHHLEELPRVRGERLDVAALPLRVDRVEGKARLPGAREPGDADQAIPRQPDGDVLQVVLAGAVDNQLVGSHSEPFYRANVCSGRGSGVRFRGTDSTRAALISPMRFRNNAGLDPSQIERPSRTRRGRIPRRRRRRRRRRSRPRRRSSIYLLIYALGGGRRRAARRPRRLDRRAGACGPGALRLQDRARTRTRVRTAGSSAT